VNTAEESLTCDWIHKHIKVHNMSVIHTDLKHMSLMSYRLAQLSIGINQSVNFREEVHSVHQLVWIIDEKYNRLDLMLYNLC